MSNDPAAKPTRGQLILLALVVLLAGALRLIFISSNEAHFDEVLNLELSTGRGSMHIKLPLNTLIEDAPAVTSLQAAPPWHAIFASLNDDPHPPLRSLLLRGWRSLLGESVAVGRLGSAILSVLCVIALFDVARQLHGSAIALWAALIFTLSSAQIVIAQEVRAYTLLILLSLVAADVMLRMQQKGPGAARAMVLGLCIFGMLLTHYFAISAVLVIGVYAMIRLRGPARNWVIGSIICGVAAFAVLWGPMIPRQSSGFFEATVPGAYGDPAADLFFRTLWRLAMAPSGLLLELGRSRSAVVVLGAALLIFPWFMLRTHPNLLLWAMWLTGVVGFVAVVDLVGGTRFLEQPRQTSLAGPAMCALLAAIGSQWTAQWRNGLPAMISISCLAALPLSYTRPQADLSLIARIIAVNAKSNEPIIFYSTPDDQWWNHILYMTTSHYSGTFPRPIARLDRPANPQLIADLQRWPGAWLIWDSRALPAETILPGGEATSFGGRLGLASVAHVRWAAPATVPADTQAHSSAQ